MQNITEVHQLRRFVPELIENVDHFSSLLKTKLESLLISAKNVYEDINKDCEQINTLLPNINNENEGELIEKSQKVKENRNRFEITLKATEKFKVLLRVLAQKHFEAVQRVEEILQQLIGLTPERIELFEHFSADESFVDEQCIVCLEDLEVGTQMVRLDCHVSHYLCKTCTDEWFKDHKTCPTCNHVFN